MIGAALTSELEAKVAAANGPPPTLQLRHLSKSFGATKALNDVALDVSPGEIHGLLGTNGSGKSTLIKVLAGYHAPDPGGSLAFNGQPVDLPLKAADFRRLGMSFVHQDLGLVPSLTVLENLRISEIALAKGGVINWRRQTAAARDILDRYGVKIETWRRVDELSAVDRALLAIVRAFEEVRRRGDETGKPGLVLLDEPTPFLPRESVDQLFDLVRQIADLGSSAIFISHDIEEVLQFTDCVTVLRDGKVSGRAKTKDVSHDDLVELIIGRRLGQTAVRSKRVAGVKGAAKTALVRFNAVSGAGVEGVSLTASEGEIIGLTGLIGSGYAVLPYLLFGAAKAESGTLQFHKAPLHTNEGQQSQVDEFHGPDIQTIPLASFTPQKALANSFALLPGDRLHQSGVGSVSIFENMLLPGFDDFKTFGLLNNRAMKQEAFRLGHSFEVRPNDPELPLRALSGGNAQKVLIAKWMARQPRLLLLDEPTQGVDVGTRARIFDALKQAAKAGMSIICASSDAEQLAAISDRVLIFARGRQIDELNGERLTKDAIAQACYGSAAGAGDPALDLNPPPYLNKTPA